MPGLVHDGRGRPLVGHPQPVRGDLERRLLVTRHPPQPCRPRGAIGDAVRVAELLGVAPATVGHRRPAEQQHADLRPEAGRQPQRVPDRIGAAAREVELAQVGVGIAEVRHVRHDAGLQGLDRQDVLEPDGHRVPGEALGVRDDDAAGVLAEDAAQRVDLRGCAAAARGRVGLVRDEEQLRRDVVTARPAELGLADDVLHHPADVVDVEPRAVERGVRGHGAEHLADRGQPALARRAGALHDDARRAHADDHPVAAPIERQRGVLDDLVGGGCA
jgi:hypothetical protein